MKVSVIVPFFNEEPYLERCIEALRHQDFPKAEYELIFVDDGSVDQSMELVRQHPEIIYLREPKRSAYAARNRGLTMARGEILAFTDADCAPSPDWLARITEGMSRTGAAVAVGRRWFPYPHGGALQRIEEYENAKIEYLLSQCPPRHLFAFTNNMAVRKDVADAVGPFAEWRRGADAEYLHRCLAHFGPTAVSYLNEMTTTHLEITGLSQWLGKQAIYGGAFRRIARETPCRLLGYRRKLEAYQHCADVHDYTFRQRFCLLGLLASGVLCFEMGKLGHFLGNQVGSR